MFAGPGHPASPRNRGRIARGTAAHGVAPAPAQSSERRFHGIRTPNRHQVSVARRTKVLLVQRARDWPARTVMSGYPPDKTDRLSMFLIKRSIASTFSLTSMVISLASLAVPNAGSNVDALGYLISTDQTHQFDSWVADQLGSPCCSLIIPSIYSTSLDHASVRISHRCCPVTGYEGSAVHLAAP